MNDDSNVKGNQDQSGEDASSFVPLDPGFSDDLDSIEVTLQTIAQQYEGDAIALLALLRRLETVHTQIRDTLFQASLPNNRQRLYALLKDIEVEGGWPYISRMKLQRFLTNFLDEDVTKPH
ncbi:MAG: hypothetical protein AB4042_16940 [Leptolyngbyaceae cyanobacterium]